MNTAFEIILYIVCVGYAIYRAYQLGFSCGEDKGRKNMQKFMTKG